MLTRVRSCLFLSRLNRPTGLPKVYRPDRLPAGLRADLFFGSLCLTNEKFKVMFSFRSPIFMFKTEQCLSKIVQNCDGPSFLQYNSITTLQVQIYSPSAHCCETYCALSHLSCWWSAPCGTTFSNAFPEFTIKAQKSEKVALKSSKKAQKKLKR